MRPLLTQWAKIFAASLADASVTDVVISPGSRSTPFVIALAREQRLRCHDVIDERAAAFYALGQARITGRPSAILCTSGSAAGHYMPAVMEANAAHIPLLLLTADRPFELQEANAPQTIDQVKLFGGHVRRFFDPGLPDESDEVLRSLRRMTAQAVFATQWPIAGPVHMNLRARKPLEPAVAQTAEEQALEQRVNRLLSRPIVDVAVPRSVPDTAMLDRVAALCRESKRGVIVLGPAPLRFRELRPLVHELVNALGFPRFAEGTSQFRFVGNDGAQDVELACDGFDVFLTSKTMAAEPPDLALLIGGGPTSDSWTRLQTQHPEMQTVVFAESAWVDPQNAASALIFGDVGAALRGLLDRLKGERATHAEERARWAQKCRRADDVVWSAVAKRIASAKELTEASAIQVVVESAPEDSVFCVGNSLPLRAIDAYCRGRGAPSLRVLCQRGVNGIDGLVAGALGTASVDSRPVTLLLGDVSFLHDLSSLAIAQTATSSVAIVVINNGGGRIFEQLPIARSGVEQDVLNHIITPHSFGFEHAAALYRLGYARPTDAAALGVAIRAAHARPGVTLIEVPTPAHGANRDRLQLYADVDGELARPQDGGRAD